MASYNKSFNFRNGVQVDDDNFIVNANGLVGIGSSIPRESLDVYGTAKITGLVTTTNLFVSGIATLSNLKVGNVSISSGIVTATTGIVTYYGNGGNLINLPTSQWVDVDSGFGYTSIYAAGNVGIATTYPNYTFQVGGNPNTSNGVGFNSTGDVYISGIVTAPNATLINLISTASTITSLRVSGIATIASLNVPVGVVTTLSGTSLTYSGTGTIATLNAPVGVVTTLSGTSLTYSNAGITTLTTTTGNITNLNSTSVNTTNLIATGIATIQTLSTVDGTIANLSGESISYNGNMRCDTLNANSGIVTTISGTTIRYGGTGTFGTLNAPVGVVTTLSGTSLTYGNAGITTLITTTGSITNLNSTSISATGNVNSNTLNANSGIVTTISGTTITYSGTGIINTLNTNTGIITTLSGTSLTYGTAGITTLTTTTGSITNLNSTNINSIGIVTASNGFVGNLTGLASSATQLYIPRDFSIIGGFVSSAATSFNGTNDVAIAATITPNSITLGTYTNGNYVRSILGTSNQIIVSSTGFPSAEPIIGLANNINIFGDLCAENRIGIGTTSPNSAVDFSNAGAGTTNQLRFMIPPKVSSADRVGLTTVEGGVIYNTTVRRLELYLGSGRGWVGVATVV
jgi:hypothetical protein